MVFFHFYELSKLVIFASFDIFFGFQTMKIPGLFLLQLQSGFL